MESSLMASAKGRQTPASSVRSPEAEKGASHRESGDEAIDAEADTGTEEEIERGFGDVGCGVWDRTFWLAWLALGLFFAGLGAGALAHVQKKGGRRQCGVYLLILGFMCILSSLIACPGVFCRKRERWPPAPRLPIGAATLIAVGLALVVLLLARLFAVSTFTTKPSELDFGFKCDAKTGKCMDNIAFEIEFNSFGHSLQGCTAGLFFPAVERFLARCSQSLPLASRWMGLGFVVYPVYNTVKRGILHGQGFAVSSYCNNAGEWCMGLLLGLAIGVFATATTEAAEGCQRCGAAPQVKDPPECCLRRCQCRCGAEPVARLVAALILAVAVLSDSVLTLTTWTWRPDAKLGRPFSPTSVFGVIVLPSLILVSTACALCWRCRRCHSCKDCESSSETTEGEAGE